MKVAIKLRTQLGRRGSGFGQRAQHGVEVGHQNRGATLASGVGERLVDADFGDEGNMGGQGVGIIGWKGGSLGLRKPQER